MKKILSIFLALVVAVGICLSAPMTIEASAAATKTKAEAVAWINSRVDGSVKNMDSLAGYQCVDMVLEYYQFLGIPALQYAAGDAVNYSKKTPPPGFTHIKDYYGFVPEAGDIAIWDVGYNGDGLGYCGHVGLVVSANLNSITIVEVWGNKNGTDSLIRKNSYPYNGGSYQHFWGVIRPKYSDAISTTGISLNTTAKTLKIGDSLTLKATVAPSNATNKTVTWSSSNTAVATVSNGVVKAVANGSVTITAKASGGQTATCTVVVAPATLKPIAKVIIGSHIYELYNTPYFIKEAFSYAKNHGGYLACLTTEEEKNLVLNWVKSSNSSIGSVVIGANDLTKEGTWQWQSGEKWSYTAWNSGEPNNSDGIEDYAVMLTGTGLWNDTKEYNIAPFVIEYDLNTYIGKGNSAAGVEVLKLPANADMSNYNKTTLYRYADKQFTTSQNDTLSGWTKYDSKTTYGDWGAAQKTWTKPTESASLKITGTQSFHKYYHYWNYYSGCHCIDSIKYGTNKGYHEIFLTYKLSAVSMADQGGKQAYGSYKCGTEGFNYWFYAGQVTQYTYQTRTVTGTNYFYKWGNWSAWSTTAVTANANRKVETQTSYTYSGHTHQKSGWTTTKNPTCTATGTKVQKCTTCGQVLATETIPAKGHTTSDWIVTKNATCDVVGSKRMECTVCKTKLHTGTIPMFGHTESGWIVDKQATSTENGSKHIECTVCHKVLKTASIDKILVLATPKVTIKNTAKGIQVNWNKIENAQSYIVYRRAYNASTKKWSGWSKLKTGVTSTSYTDKTVKLGTHYRYTVRAVNGDVMSKYTSTSTLKYNVTPTVKIANASNGIKVSWSTAANATGYTVYRSQYNTKTKKWTSWKNMGTAKSNKTSWTDKKVTSGVKYKYTVRACNGSIKSSYKASANLLYLAQPTVKIANNANGVKVSWSKVSGATGYTVYRSEYKNSTWTKWSNRGTAKSNKTSWTDKKVTSGVQYKYTVRAINGNYKSSYKGTGGLLYLAQPTVTVANTNNGIKVSWTQSAGVTGYTVYSSKYLTSCNKWSSWQNIGTVNANKTSFVDVNNIISGEKYKYTVRAVNGNTKSTYVSSDILKCSITEINSSNVKMVFSPIFQYYYLNLTDRQHVDSVDFLGEDYIRLLPKSWYEKYGVASDGSAMISVHKFVAPKTPAKLKEEYKKYLSASIIDEYDYMFTDYSLLQVNGEMYSIIYGGRGSIHFDANSIEFRGKKNGGYLVAIDVYNSGLNYCGTDVFFIKYTDGRFIIDSLYKVEENHSLNYTNPNADWI